MIDYFWEAGYDKDNWNHVKIAFVDQILSKVIRATHQQVLITFFQ